MRDIALVKNGVRVEVFRPRHAPTATVSRVKFSETLTQLRSASGNLTQVRERFSPSVSMLVVCGFVFAATATAPDLRHLSADRIHPGASRVSVRQPNELHRKARRVDSNSEFGARFGETSAPQKANVARRRVPHRRPFHHAPARLGQRGSGGSRRNRSE